MCLECKEMYGNAVFKDMCSKCYKKSLDDAEKNVELILKKSNTSVSTGRTGESVVKPAAREKNEKSSMAAKEEKQLDNQTEEQ